jgi:hypothetical protein
MVLAARAPAPAAAGRLAAKSRPARAARGPAPAAARAAASSGAAAAAPRAKPAALHEAFAEAAAAMRLDLRWDEGTPLFAFDVLKSQAFDTLDFEDHAPDAAAAARAQRRVADLEAALTA